MTWVEDIQVWEDIGQRTWGLALEARLEKYQVVEAQQRLPYLAERLKLGGV